MKPSFALTLIIYAYLTPVFLRPHAVNTAIGAESDTPPAAAQEQAAGNEAQFRSPLFEALEIHASEEAGRQIAGSGEAAHRDPGTAWDKERAFAGMEGDARRDRDVERSARRTTGTAFSGTASGSRPVGRLPSCRRASAERQCSAPGARCCPRPSERQAGTKPARSPGRPIHQPNTPCRTCLETDQRRMNCNDRLDDWRP